MLQKVKIQQDIPYLSLMSTYRYYGTGMAKSPCTLAQETIRQNESLIF